MAALGHSPNSVTWSGAIGYKSGRPSGSRHQFSAPTRSNRATFIFVMGTLLHAFALLACFASTYSAPDNRGTEFVIGYTANYATRNQVHLFITTSKTTTVSVSVTAPRYSTVALNSQFTITAGEVKQLYIDNRIRGAGSELSSKGILITASDEVVVYGTNIETYSNDAFLAFPTDVLGMEYYTVSHHPTTKECQFMVVGVLDNTRVTITLGTHSSIEVYYNNRYYYKNQKISLTMNRYDTLQLQTYGDLTGSHVESNKNVAVFSGNKRTSVLPGTSRDTLVDQMLPVSVWGKRFAIVPTPERTTGDSMRFIAAVRNTALTITCSGGWSRSTTIGSAGGFVNYVTPSDQCCFAESNEGIMVILIVISQTLSNEPADPALITIPPIEQYGADYTFSTPKYSYGEYRNFFMFIVKASEKTGLKANGAAFPAGTVYTAIPNTDYVGGYVVLPPGTHTIRHDSPISVFGGFMYGTATYETYGMPTGLRMAPINEPCVATTTVVGDGIDNDCDGLIDEELCTPENKAADDDGDGVADEDCATPPPINGVWNSWTAYTTCSISCGTGSGGTKTRTRACDNPAPQYDGTQCAGSGSVTVSCTSTTPCPVDGGWASWGSYGSCSVTCASGSKTRSRSCTSPTPAHNGATCAGSSSSSATCNTGVNCPVNGGLTTWSSWGTCSQTCGTGASTRARSCTSPAPAYGGAACSGSSSESRTCNTQACPIDGGWVVWTAWTSCPVTCGSGRITRTRTCTSPTPQHGGANCTGYATGDTSCVLGNCPVDGGYTQWTLWSTCTVTCAGGTSGRTRTCTDPVPAHGGVDCMGVTSESQTCNTLNCPIDGGYTTWTAWSSCGITCGNSTVTRTRTCTNPTPQYNGASCAGAASETTGCYAGIMCPIDGAFTTWTAWDTCTVTCAGGTQDRTRTCTNPTPQYLGAACVGVTSEQQTCNTLNCPIDGGWTDWTTWSDCSSTCGPGLSTVDRTCTNPPAQYNGAGCLGLPQNSQACNGSCTVDGLWGAWGAWTTCTKTCDIGRAGRVRLCDNPAPTTDGQPCFGDSFIIQLCNVQPCSGGTYANGSAMEASYVNRCPNGYFTCQSGRITCIHEDFRCDCASDCEDSSEETVSWASCDSVALAMCESAATGIQPMLGLVLGLLMSLLMRNLV